MIVVCMICEKEFELPDLNNVDIDFDGTPIVVCGDPSHDEPIPLDFDCLSDVVERTALACACGAVTIDARVCSACGANL